MQDRSHIVLIEQLFKKYQPALVAYAHQFVRSGEDAREIVQEVFISVWNNREKLDSEGNLKAYLYTATRNKCFNFLQKRRLSIVDLEAAPDAVNPGYSMEEKMEAAELRAEIFDEIHRLPERCRQIFLLSRRDGLSHREIAQKMDLAEKTVENQIGIALKRIRERVYGTDGRGGLLGIMLCLAFGLLMVSSNCWR